MGQPEVLRYMTVGAFAIGADQSLSAARELMAEHGIRHLPVIQGGAVVGVVSARDLGFLERLPGVGDQITVSKAMTPEPFVVNPDSPLDQVAGEMAKRKIGSAVVVEHGKVVGMFTGVDALRALSDVLAARED